MIDSVLAPTVQNTTTPAFLGLRSRFDQIYLVISPPRCASTAFSRVFWQHERLRYYSHEPFEATYFMGRPTSDALQKLKHPIDLLTLAPFDSHDGAGALLVKEMPYQVGGSFPQLAALSEHPDHLPDQRSALEYLIAYAVQGAGSRFAAVPPYRERLGAFG